MTKLLIIWLVIVWFSAVQGIYNGQIANKHQFPYLVYIRSSQFYCAGSLISDRHVLTAAHCLMRSSSILIILGIHENYGWGYSDGVNAISTKFWIHENFSLPLAQNDIGIVELPKSVYKYVNNTRKVKSIGISPTTDIDLNESEVITAGWGHTAQYTIANRPYYTKMSLIYTTECIKYQGHYIEAITKDHICTMKITGMPCDGDSGAPIVSLKTNKVVGVLSYVKDAENGIYMHYNDCKSKVPAVSTRISSYIDWISAKTGIDFSKTEKVCNINRLVNATNIDQFEGCEIIEGRIEINNESFSEMEPEKLEVFSSVKVLRGDLKVSGNHENFKDLSFLRNLEGINGAVFIENTSLKSLGLNSLLFIKNGGVHITFNKNLCFAGKINWFKIMDANAFHIDVKSNRNEIECSADNEICSDDCTASGCWGKEVNQCLENSDNFNEINNENI